MSHWLYSPRTAERYAHLLKPMLTSNELTIRHHNADSLARILRGVIKGAWERNEPLGELYRAVNISARNGFVLITRRIPPSVVPVEPVDWVKELAKEKSGGKETQS